MSRIVCDASALVALTLDSGPEGRWVDEALRGTQDLVAPSLVSFEAANIVRRLELAGLVSADQAALAHADLLELARELWPYEAVADRVRELRRNLTAYDASYVAVAEAAGAQLVTLDARLARAPGLRCTILSP